MYAKGIELYCAPTVDDRDSWCPSMRHIACEGRCYVLSACQFLTRFACPVPFAGAPEGDPGAVLIRGGSCIVSPLGKVLAGPTFNCEIILTAQIDPAEIVRGKFDLDVAGHYARADIFQLRVNEAARPPVAWLRVDDLDQE
jgi:nitrilase